MKVTDLIPDEHNANKGTQRGLKALDHSLRQYGAGRSILIDKKGRVIAGNKTVERAADIGLDDVIVVQSDGTKLVAVQRTDLDLETDKAARELAWADNRVGQLDLDWEPLQLAADLEAGLDLTGLFDPAELSEILERAGTELLKGKQDPGPQIDKAAELKEKWGTCLGQLWALGKHRLICGDCTDRATVERVMEGERAALSASDPPYNVGIEYGEDVDDRKIGAEYEQFSRGWFGLAQEFSQRQIVTPGCYNLALWLRWFDAYHWAPWTKTNSMTNGRVSRFWCWEPVLFFGDKWKRARSNDVFDYPIGQQKGVANHPCPKPLKMWLDLIENYSESGDTVYEPFSGSGTTLIACENLGRVCRACEIDPGYVGVSLQRWADLTGRQPVLQS